ncbi:molybdopterin molybdenumtransferase [Janthinobacterium sp. HH103]|uniref:molybdopterin molybdotransferase MoeA n=1 Tax=unclassified Janthinobacterium TaxID=2610881 RepID=UPI0008737DE1|nr:MULTISPECIES: gephyrin-like molybdotransferase Glp [unclassified Janthinobacterium]OEZ54138.1 molybdopterin molybdenumtransferase [Janthinobacterium sp. HH100]OEZ85804.1 molybdopterin molybdenumtransferase [Janthinobacterium sp. HH103]QOU73551.1 Molybdopterin molybdenumtransferase [Janthinobacterium sp. HH102]
MSDPTAQRKPMLSVAEAQAFMLGAARPVTEVELVDTMRANGRVLATAQTSTLNVPERDNTQMDGYAVRASDCASGAASLPVSQRIAAGHVGQPLQPGTAARIFTGALIPEGADCVVMQEQCTAADGMVTVNHVPKAGEWVRRQGEDIRAGGVILGAGRRLRSQEMGLAASVGLAQVPVLRKLRVAVFFTGDELAMPGEPLAPGAVYNSNRFTLRGLLENLGCEITDLGIVPDSLEATRAVLRQAAQGNDLIITSGGVSVGEEDHIKPAVEAEGRLNMWQIAVKPGKPLAFGEVREAFFIGLPGNPVSSFVTFLLFVRPFILRLQGVAGSLAPRSYKLPAAFERLKADKRNEFLRAKVNDEGELELFANQSSGVLTSTVWGDGLIDCPPGLSIARGDMLRFIPFNELLY